MLLRFKLSRLTKSLRTLKIRQAALQRDLAHNALNISIATDKLRNAKREIERKEEKKIWQS